VNNDSVYGGSNGSGKSSFFDAIYYALYGKTSKGTSGSDVVKWGKKHCRVHLDFKIGEESYSVVRERRGTSGSLQFYLNSEDISLPDARKTQSELIDSLIPESVFRNAVFFAGSFLHSFIDASDREKKALFTILLGIEKVEDLATIARKRATEAATATLQAKARSEARSQQLSDTTSLLEKAKEFEIHVKESWRQEEETQEDTKALHLTIEKDETHLSVVQTTIKALTGKIDDLYKQISERKDLFAADSKTLKAQIDDIGIRIATNGEHQIVRERRLSVIYSKIDDLMRLKESGVCPVCDSVLEATSIEAKMKLLNDEKSIIDAEGKQYSEEDTRLRSERTEKSLELEEIEKKYREDLKNLEKQQEEEKTKRNLETSEERIVEEKLKKLRGRLEAATNFKVRKDAAIAEVKSKVVTYKETLDKLQAQLKEDASQLVELEKKQGIAEFWSTAFGPSGIVSYLFDFHLPRFNQKLNDIVSDLFGMPLVVRFTPMTTLKSGDVREKWDFEITGLGDYSSCSSGQKRRLDIAVLLALSDLMAEQMGGVNVMFLDELLDPLDAPGCEAVMDWLRRKKSTVFLVTHSPSLSGQFDKTLTVEMSGKTAVVKET
jgi:DNA repair exonuclease SbcCD ATPase subunit